MMSKLVYGVGVLALIGAALAFALGARQWGQDDPKGGLVPEIAVGERARVLSGHDPGQGRGAVSPLVAQATAFALYLNPPQPASPPAVTRAPVTPPPAPRPVAATPPFRLLLTSCHRSEPQKSLALVSAPGQGDHWVRNGDRVGHLVIESIRDGSLLYREGNQVREMSVTMRQTAALARVVSAPAGALPGVVSEAQLLDAARMKESDVPVPGVEAAAQGRD